MVVLTRLVVLFALLALTSCWSPVFDADVSLAALTESKLSLEASFTGTVNNNGDSSVFVAYPDLQRPPTRVAVVGLNSTSLGLTNFQYASGQWTSPGYSTGYGYDTPLADPESATLHAGLDTSVFSLAAFLPTTGNGVVYYLDSAAAYPILGITSPAEMGVATIPSPSTHTDMLIYQLSNFGAGTLTLETNVSSAAKPFDAGLGAAWTWPSSSLSTSYGWLAVNPVPVIPIGYLTHHDKVDGKYVTDMFDNTEVLHTWIRSDRVEAFLSNQQLLTRDGGFYNVCDTQGNIQYSFPAGRLKFVGESWVGSEYRVWFSEVLSENGSQGDSGARIRIYSLATNQLGSLK